MTGNSIYLGKSLRRNEEKLVEGKFVSIDGVEFYRISHSDAMRPFFMSIVSDSDHWMFVASNGGLTAGRKNPDHALFPYYTDDKIIDGAEETGSKTIVIVVDEERSILWEPFSNRYEGVYDCHRSVYKSVYGNELLFEEQNNDLGLVYSYRWSNSESYGFVKSATLQNISATSKSVRVLDGLQNVLPHGVLMTMQRDRSTLVDAYKKNELLRHSGIGIFSLSARIVDRAEPSEALKTTTIWSMGLEDPNYLLSNRQLDAFRSGAALQTEVDLRAERGAYFVESNIELRPEASKDWFFVAEVDQGPSELAALELLLEDPSNCINKVQESIKDGRDRLRHIVAQADGLQCSGDQMTCVRHYSNVLFNLMRGGAIDNQYDCGREDIIDFIATRSRAVKNEHKMFLESLPEVLEIGKLLELAEAEDDANLLRLCYSYLPIYFSRRHGDPSRPWNAFSIDTRNPDGSKNFQYQGNWRDIFQNWEAISVSYPSFVDNMIATFVNASTADGYNPYRITRDGIDWEKHEPEDPWSYIGYWGDHQIIYLLKLLELSRMHSPEKLLGLLNRELFSYANVPYRIKGYDEILDDPQNTVDFDEGLDRDLEELSKKVGTDGKLISDQEGDVYLVSLTEKLLVSLLAKLSNFVPEAGIWLNTQRPEWNDANNALVGNGASMVTTYYLHRFLEFLRELFSESEDQEFSVSAEVQSLFQDICRVLSDHSSVLEEAPISDLDRRRIINGLGMAGSDYRESVYAGFQGEKKELAAADIENLLELSLAYVDHAISSNQGEDNLYHAYNLIANAPNACSVSHLYEMLEGQVGILSSGVLNGVEVVGLLDSLRSSELYRPDQISYILYPNRKLARFDEKNIITEAQLSRSVYLQTQLGENDRSIIEKDGKGRLHFNPDFRNARDLAESISIAEASGKEVSEAEISTVLEIYEELFDHVSYTGRSGTFFGYEGLGSIYWHMVSKLVLAIGECYQRAMDNGETADVIASLREHYYESRAGIGLDKTPEVYGAFPFDPYSHTPGNAGAQQPGMTGQVKEDILCRWIELGVRVRDGQVEFNPHLLREEEFLTLESSYSYFDVNGSEMKIELNPGSLAFTYCQVPIVYRKGSSQVQLVFKNGKIMRQESSLLSPSDSRLLWERRGELERIEVGIEGLRGREGKLIPFSFAGSTASQ